MLKYHHVTRSHRKITESLVKEMNSKEGAAVSDNAETNRKINTLFFYKCGIRHDQGSGVINTERGNHGIVDKGSDRGSLICDFVHTNQNQ